MTLGWCVQLVRVDSDAVVDDPQQDGGGAGGSVRGVGAEGDADLVGPRVFGDVGQRFSGHPVQGGDDVAVQFR